MLLPRKALRILQISSTGMAKYGVTCNVIRPVAAWRGAITKVAEFEANVRRTWRYW
jgi:hypothetical protein